MDEEINFPGCEPGCFPGCEPGSRYPDVYAVGNAIFAYGKMYGLTPRQLETIFNAGVGALAAAVDWIPGPDTPKVWLPGTEFPRAASDA